MPRAFAEIDSAAITANTRTLNQRAPQSRLCAVVKADGYGHGAATAARAALVGGANYLGVAQVDEGIALREAGIDAPIWLLSEPDEDEFVHCRRFDLEPALYTERGYQAAVRAAGSASLRVHPTIDTGMHRVGLAPAGAATQVAAIAAEPNLEIGSVWTHLAVADEPGNPYTSSQLDLFDRVLADIAANGIEVPLIHVANSAGTIAVPEARRDVVRPGVALYGMPPSPDLDGMVELLPAMKLWTSVSFVKELDAGERLSYGLRTTLERRTTVATLPIGYADGVHRRWWETGSVLVAGERCQILGVVTMDQMMVDVTGLDVGLGDEAVLIGQQGGETISASEWAAALGTINYEITCGIGPRVTRIPAR